MFVSKLDKKACGLSNQETRIVGGKPTGVNVRNKKTEIFYIGLMIVLFIVIINNAFSNIHGLPDSV